MRLVKDSQRSDHSLTFMGLSMNNPVKIRLPLISTLLYCSSKLYRNLTPARLLPFTGTDKKAALITSLSVASYCPHNPVCWIVKVLRQQIGSEGEPPPG